MRIGVCSFVLLLAVGGCDLIFPYGSGGAGSAPSCVQQDNCADGTNCQGGRCVPAALSCAEQKALHPASVDGVYWIRPATGSAYRAYCDSQLGTELCSETQGTHQGQTREGSKLAYLMTSVLRYDVGICELWNLHATDDYPMDRLEKPQSTMSTCAAFGFLDDDTLGRCQFGEYYSNCGFAIGTAYYRYGNQCSGCGEKNNGVYPRYVLQGYIYDGYVLTSANGSTRVRCRVR